MGSAKHNLQPLIFSEYLAGTAQPGEQLIRQPQGMDQLPVIFAGFCTDQTAGGGVGIFMGSSAAELIHQPAGQHQKIRDAFQTAGFPVRHQLIDSIERLELDAGMPVKQIKGNLLMNPRNDGFRPAVPVGIAGQNLLIPFHQHIVHTPGIHGKADQIRIGFPGPADAFLYIVQQAENIPDQMAFLLLYSVGKTENLFCFQLPFLLPADNMPPGGSSDVHRKIVLHSNPSRSLMHPL